MAMVLLLLAGLAALIWGFYQNRAGGDRIGLLVWLQSVALVAPWLLVFTLAAAGIFLRLVVVLGLLVLSTGLYIVLGRWIRTIGQEREQSLRSRYANPPEGKDSELENGHETSLEREGRQSSLDTQPDNALSEGRSPSGSPTGSPPSGSPISGSPISGPPIMASSLNTSGGASMRMPAEEVKTIQGIFGIDTFFATDTIPYLEGVIFKGNLRGEPKLTFERLSESLARRVGDRYRLFLVENQEGKPVVIVLPRARDPQRSSWRQYLLAFGLLLITALTCLDQGGFQFGEDILANVDRYRQTWPLAAGIFGVLAAHELGHWVLAWHHRLRLSPPFLLPIWQLGSFGAITRFESLVPNRSVLFDVAFAGPALGGLVSLVFLVVGFLLSPPAGAESIPTEFFKSSILVGMVARLMLGSATHNSLVALHPLALVGWVGLLITALNLLPAGQLDGGRMVQAIYGRMVVGRTTIFSLILLAIATLTNPIFLYWAIVIFVLQRDLERPALNELTEPNDVRAALALFILFLAAAVLLPLAPSLAGQLGIGG